MPRTSRPQSGNSLGGLKPATGLIEPASTRVRDRGGHAESRRTQRAHIAPLEHAVCVLDAPRGRVRVRGRGDERSVYPHDRVRLQPALAGHAEAALQQPASLLRPAAGDSGLGEPVHGQYLSRCATCPLV